MPRAAPGVIARGALCWKIPGEPRIPVQVLGWYMEGYSSRSRSEACIRPDVREFQRSKSFTPHSSGFRVERGRLGEVVSLVGDCRPPPPGNPHQPIIQTRISRWDGGLGKNPLNNDGFVAFFHKWQKNGGVNLPMYKQHSFNNNKNHTNLKNFNPAQYFKNIRSYSSCAVKCTVLEFDGSHCHLYGFWLVGPPSIAITNVLTL
jgi:hypothetical protein